MSHPRSFPTSERESVIISPKPLPRTGASLQDSAASDMAALDDDGENSHIRRVHAWDSRGLRQCLRTVLLELLTALVAFAMGLVWGMSRVSCNNCLFVDAAVVAGVVVILTVCYWMAARDLKRYPGPQSARSC